ncbi:MAG: TetR/AcrR family transcriptional regulator [Pirellulales bacterium]
MKAATPLRRGSGRPRDAKLPERRRREILEIATRKFAQHGYADTDLQLVADELRVGKGTVYRYFPSKELLFLAAVDQGMQQLSVAIDQAVVKAATALERVEFGIRAYLQYFDEHADVIELLMQERAFFRDRERPTYFVHQDANIGPWMELFRELIRDGSVRDVPVHRISDVISDLLYGTIFTNYFARRKKSLASQCADVLDILFRGILSERKRGVDAKSHKNN